ncbi:MAG: hypothetical protein IJM17_02450 [Firmicutes bacterium]|nr:hypothetical protein [Bacillota bacterium]
MMRKLAERVHASGKIYELLYGRKAMGRVRLARLFSARNGRKNASRLEKSGLKAGLLLRQGAGAPSDGLRFGISSMKRSGCEVMAAYNALSLAGKAPELVGLIKEFEKRGASLGGIFGASPHAIEDVLNENGLKAVYHGPSEAAGFDALLENCGLGVLSFWWGASSLVIHTVVVERERPATGTPTRGPIFEAQALRPLYTGPLKAYNFSGKEDFSVFSSIDEMKKKRGIVPICFISVERADGPEKEI